MAPGLWPQSQPNHLLPFLQHTGFLVSAKALLYNPGCSPPVIMRRQAVYHPTNKHSNVWRWLRQFLMWHAEDSSTSSLLWWGVGTGIQSQPAIFLRRLHPAISAIVKIIIGKSVSPPWTTPPGFTARWSSSIDNLGDWLPSDKRVN
jgi:hypothetical protein